MIGWEDSPRSTAIPSIENTTTITVSTPDPPQTDSFTVDWDKTLTWANTLSQVNLLKSVGNGIEVFVRPKALIISLGKNQSSSVSGCDLPKFDPWGEEIVKFVDHMWVVGSNNLIMSP